MAIVWPPTLPQSPLYGWTDGVGSGAIRTETDAGPVKVRRRYTAAVDPMTWPLALTKAQWADLKTFWRTTTYSGVSEFDIVHPETGSTVTVRFNMPQGLQFIETGPNVYVGNVVFEVLP